MSQPHLRLHHQVIRKRRSCTLIGATGLMLLLAMLVLLIYSFQ